MSIDTDVAVLRQRVTRAERERDTWRAAGWQENYLAACSTVDALHAQIDFLERAARRAAASATMAEPRLTL